MNIVAATARNNAIRNVQNNFTLRNNFTTKQIRFTKCAANVKTFRQIKSETGATDRIPYMERQEKGGTHRGANGNLIIPTTKARGGSNTKTVRRPYYYSAIKPLIVHGSTGFKSKKAAHVARAFVAAKTHGYPHEQFYI